MTKYVICAGSGPRLDINEDKFKRLKQARRCLTAALAIEEKYELLLSSYLELEREHLNIALDYMVRNPTDDSDFFDIRLTFNRRIANLLTSTKLYFDQIQQHIKSCAPNCSKLQIKNIVEIQSLDEYNKFPEYRFMEALRNYIQHQGLVVHSTDSSSHHKDEGLEFNVRFFTHKTEVNKDGQFKVSNEMPDKVELTHAIRVYVGSISEIHCKLRELIKGNSDKARRLIQESINEYKNTNGRNPVDLNVIKIASGETSEKFPLLLKWDNIRLKLIEKNNNLVSLGKRYISNSCL